MNEDGGKAFIDTGTTFVYFDHPLFFQFKRSISDYCYANNSNCAKNVDYQECYFWDQVTYPKKIDFLKTFPTITFDFKGVPLQWYPEDYFVEPASSSTHLCIGVKPLKNAILGAVLMRNYDFFIDRSAKKIGFARSNCG